MNKKYYFTRAFTLILLIFAIGIFYQIVLYQTDLEKEGWLKLKYNSVFAIKPSLIYFSSSTNKACAPNDTNLNSISDFINEDLRNNKIISFDTGAIHAGVFLKVLENLKYVPKVVVVDLNLRSFGKNWIESPLENSIQRNLTYFKSDIGLFNRLNVMLKNYAYKSEIERQRMIEYDEKFAKLPFQHPHNKISNWLDSCRKYQDNTPSVQMVRNFGFLLKKDNDMLNHFDKIRELCKRKKIKLIFVLLPENTQGMMHYVGNDLVKLININISFLKKHFNDVTLIDCVNILNEKHFFEEFPTEHYNQEGRKLVADKIQKNIINFFY